MVFSQLALRSLVDGNFSFLTSRLRSEESSKHALGFGVAGSSTPPKRCADTPRVVVCKRAVSCRRLKFLNQVFMCGGLFPDVPNFGEGHRGS